MLPILHRNPLAIIPAFLFLLMLGFNSSDVRSQSIPPDEVLDLFDDRCAFAGCHAGANPSASLDMSEEFVFASLVNKNSRQKKDRKLIKPQDPANSYLMMKIAGHPDISGDRMPLRGQPLTAAEVAILANWIDSLPQTAQAEMPVKPYTVNFPGLTSGTLPTTQTLPFGFLSYRVAHRWRGELSSGFANFFGLDAGAVTLLELAFPIRDNIMFYTSRSPVNATFEFAFKWRFIKQSTDGSNPVSGAVNVGVDWATRKQLTGVEGEIPRGDSERFAPFVQVVLSRKIGKFSLLTVPGILFNHNPTKSDEQALITLGLTGKYLFSSNFGVFAEWVPILSGQNDAYVVEGPVTKDGKQVFYDSFTAGFELEAGLHVFHIYVANSLGLSTSHYMNGGNLDFFSGEMRFGFNIYRAFNLSR